MCNNRIYLLVYMNEKEHCKNCGDQVGDDDNSSNEFCSEQCGVEYQLEHK
jgi:predicted nucleic acid-binding Zn ribbon protein